MFCDDSVAPATWIAQCLWCYFYDIEEVFEGSYYLYTHKKYYIARIAYKHCMFQQSVCVVMCGHNNFPGTSFRFLI